MKIHDKKAVYIKPNWLVSPQVKAFTTTRKGGFSEAPFASFNLNLNSGDDLQAVQKNREKLLNDLVLPSEPVWLKQTHSCRVLCLDDYVGGDEKTRMFDASFTTKPGKVCAVFSADCLPVLLAAKDATVVAAIHAGWKGLCAGVIESTVNSIQKRLQRDDLQFTVWLGPCIGEKVFEVGGEVREQFMAVDENAKRAFVAKKNQKWIGDLRLIAKQRLAKLGITDVYRSDLCTYSDPTRFYSYRRDGEKYGRLASLIWLLS